MFLSKTADKGLFYGPLPEICKGSVRNRSVRGTDVCFSLLQQWIFGPIKEAYGPVLGFLKPEYTYGPCFLE